jgi:chromosome segregation ATPase
VAYDQQIKELTKQANEKNKLARATTNLAAKLELQQEAKTLKRQVDDLQHQLYTRLREIDDEREAMLDVIAEQLNLTPQVDHLFTIRWSLI